MALPLSCPRMGSISPNSVWNFLSKPTPQFHMQPQQSAYKFRCPPPPSFRDRSCVELCFFHSGLASFALMSSEFPVLYFLFGFFVPFLTPPESEKMLPNKTWLCRRCIMLKLRSLTVICYCCCPWLPLLGASAFLCLLGGHGMDEHLTSGDLRFSAQENFDEFRHFLHSMTFVF